MHLRMLFSIATLLLLCACVPYRLTERPAMSGMAIADPGREPIAGAAVRLSLARQGKVFEAHDLTTDRKGRFTLVRQTSWSFWDQSEWTGYTVKVEIRASGYRTEKREIRWLDSGPPILKFGAVPMKLLGDAAQPATQ